MTEITRDDDLVAAEYALGLMEAAEAEAFAARVEADPVLAEAVARWQARLVDLDLTAPPATPDETLWTRITAGVDVPVALPPSDAAAAATSSASLPPPAPRTTSRARDAARTPLQRRLAGWRAAAFIATAAALVLAVVSTRLILAVPEPTMLAVLIGPDGRAGAVVQVFEDGRTKLVSLDDVAVPEGRALEVWTKWSDERGPVSVGVLPQATSAALTTQGLPLPQADQLYEISLEPAGGSPTGKPTGPVLFKGTATPTL